MRTGLSAIGYTIIGIICLVLIIGAGAGIEAAGYQWYAPWIANKKTEVIRNTNQFVATQQEKINGLMSEYNSLFNSITYYKPTPENATLVQGFMSQQRAKIIDMCAAANLIDAQYVPEVAKPLMRQEGCWNE